MDPHQKQSQELTLAIKSLAYYSIEEILIVKDRVLRSKAHGV
jgi:hypothetical protein